MNKIALLLLTTAAAVASGQNTTTTVMNPSCDLECTNSGYCTLIEGTAEQLAREAQAGHLIEVCVCPPGFTGVACENILEQCALPERRCHNGAPCSKDEHGEWECDCSFADVMGNFAGEMCRKPITEYCTGEFQPGSALFFCTNGGRCLSDFIAAKVAPGDTSVNKRYQNAGCLCSPEFYGPHCEFLRLNSMEEELPPVRTNNSKVQSPATAILLAIMSLGLVILATLIHFKRRQIGLQEQNPTRGDNSVSTVSDRNWGESVRYAGRRHEDQYSDGTDDLYSDGFNDEFTSVSGSSTQLDTVLELETIHLD